jgi:hypothetical protein
MNDKFDQIENKLKGVNDTFKGVKSELKEVANVLRDSAPDRKDRRGILSDAGTSILSLLLALIVKGTLDGLFGHIGDHFEDYQDVHAYVVQNWYDVGRYSLHFGVFLLTVFRFYLGNLRHHQQVKKLSRRRDFWVAFCTTMALFSLFYMAGLLVRKDDLFYVAMLATQVVSILCSGLTAEVTSGASRRVWYCFVAFDMINSIALLLTFYLWNDYPILAPACSLFTLTIVGVLDIWKFWPFYIEEENWENDIWPNRFWAWVDSRKKEPSA